MLKKTFKYSSKNAAICARLSRIVYDVNHADDIWKLKDEYELGFEYVHFFQSNGTQGFIIICGGFIIVCFRGTEIKEWEDLKADIKIKQTGGPLEGKVHRGFLGALLECWTEFDQEDGTKHQGIESLIHELRDEYAKANGQKPALIFTGHSLGAGLATLATAFFLEENIPVMALYTFGSPRVGNAMFAASFNAHFKRHYRIVNNNDIVTRLPPRAYRGYKHCGDFTYFMEDGSLDHDPSTWELMLDMAMGHYHDLGEPGIDSIKDHGSAEYERITLKLINFKD